MNHVQRCRCRCRLGELGSREGEGQGVSSLRKFNKPQRETKNQTSIPTFFLFSSSKAIKPSFSSMTMRGGKSASGIICWLKTQNKANQSTKLECKAATKGGQNPTHMFLENLDESCLKQLVSGVNGLLCCQALRLHELISGQSFPFKGYHHRMQLKAFWPHMLNLPEV